MKKNLLLAAMAAAAMTSCSNDDVIEVNQGKGITFRASIDNPLTRGTVTRQADLSEFKVTAIGNGESYFKDLLVNGGPTNWTPAATYYWPNYQLDFFAYAPVTPSGTVTIDNAGKKIEGFTSGTDVAAQQDLLISYNKGTKAKNETSGVTLNFKHALSQIEVKAKNGNTNMDIQVIGVKLVGAGSKGDFTFPEEETTSSKAVPQNKWTNVTENDHSKAYMVKGDAAVTLTADAQSIMFGADNNIFVIPQKLTAWTNNTARTGAYLSVLCRISTKGADGSTTLIYPQPAVGDPKTDKYAFSAVAIDTNWEPGKKYIYTLNFCDATTGSGAGRIDPNPTVPGGTDTSVDSTVPAGSKPGDTILGAAIKYTVTVDEWKDQVVSPDPKLD